MLENGKEVCTCKYKSCRRHGDCGACMSHHQTHKKYPPYCKRKKAKEASEPDKKA
jgi:hypothetical protein